MENQMVCIIPFGVFLKLQASGQSVAFLLLLLGFTVDVHTFCFPCILLAKMVSTPNVTVHGTTGAVGVNESIANSWKPLLINSKIRCRFSRGTELRLIFDRISTPYKLLYYALVTCAIYLSGTKKTPWWPRSNRILVSQCSARHFLYCVVGRYEEKARSIDKILCTPVPVPRNSARVLPLEVVHSCPGRVPRVLLWHRQNAVCPRPSLNVSKVDSLFFTR